MASRQPPARIFAKVNGARTAMPGNVTRLVGGWDQIRDGGATEYVRVDIADGMLQALKHLRDECCGPSRPWVLVDLLTDAEEAIAKAEGRP